MQKRGLKQCQAIEQTPESWTVDGLVRSEPPAIVNGTQALQFQFDSILVVIMDVVIESGLQFLKAAEVVEVGEL